MRSTCLALYLLSLVGSHVGVGYADVRPQVKGTPKVVANVTDPTLNRDSCGSVKIEDRVLWVCRDTTVFNAQTGRTMLPLEPNSASWTDLDASGGPRIIHNAPRGAGSTGSNPVLLMYGGSYNTSEPRPFYPLTKDECAPNGICSNGTGRYAMWPNQPPMIARTSSDGTVTAYTWIDKHLIYGHQNLTEKYPNQPYSLYRFVYAPPKTHADPAPQPVLVSEDFWKAGEWGFGGSGTVVRNGTAYLYAQNDNRTAVALAKVAVDGIEDRTRYSYYVNGAWTKKMPALDDAAALIPQLGAGHQGTFYYSEAFHSYIWIGEDPSVSATKGMINFVLSTAPAPEGPWIAPYFIHAEPKGNAKFGAYSIQAHTSFIPNASANRSIYLTYTKETTYEDVTPLIYLEFQ